MQDEVDRIYWLAVVYDIDTAYVADRYDVSRCRVQQFAEEYCDTGDLPTIETSGRKSFVEYPADLVDGLLNLYQIREQRTEAIVHMLPPTRRPHNRQTTAYTRSSGSTST